VCDAIRVSARPSPLLDPKGVGAARPVVYNAVFLRFSLGPRLGCSFRQ